MLIFLPAAWWRSQKKLPYEQCAPRLSIKDAKALGDLFGDYLGFAVHRFNNQSSKEMCT